MIELPDELHQAITRDLAAEWQKYPPLAGNLPIHEATVYQTGRWTSDESIIWLRVGQLYISGPEKAWTALINEVFHTMIAGPECDGQEAFDLEADR